MVYEQDILRELRSVESSPEEPAAKARRLLELANRIREGAAKLAECAAMLVMDGLEEQAARMRLAVRRLLGLRRQIRQAARRLIAEAGRRVGSSARAETANA